MNNQEDEDSDLITDAYEPDSCSCSSDGKLVPSIPSNVIEQTPLHVSAEAENNLKHTDVYTSISKSSGVAKSRFSSTYPNSMIEMLKVREFGRHWYRPQKCKIANLFLPNHNWPIARYKSKAFCGIFNKDGSRFVTGSQDEKIRLYKSDDESYRPLKTIVGADVGWSIIDLEFTPDERSVVYTSWSSSVYQIPLYENGCQVPLGFVDVNSRFCIFKLAFANNGKEIVGGANDGRVYIYDLTRSKVISTIMCHKYDVNALAVPDESPELIYTGGDDGIVQVWDRRELRVSAQAAGQLAGHQHGITYIDTKRDGRFLLSSSKDQTIKLWDLRRFSSAEAVRRSQKAAYDQLWDYRWQNPPTPPTKVSNRPERQFKLKLEGDTSVMTYTGAHAMLKTLIRCHFSPLETTGQRYVYTGCGDGNLVVYDALTGDVVLKRRGHQTCVRDVAWHPYRNEIVTTSWDGVIKKWTYRNKRMRK